MLLKLPTALIFGCLSVAFSAQTNQLSFDDAIKALRSSGEVSSFHSGSSKALQIEPSFVETETPKKPLSVAQFSEWLHNLYYNEKEKRDSAIKSLLANDPLRSDNKIRHRYS